MKNVRVNNLVYCLKKITFIEQYLLPEFKQVTYFIKKPEDPTNSLFVKKIQELPEVQIAYSIAEKAIKSTKNIIFD